MRPKELFEVSTPSPSDSYHCTLGERRDTAHGGVHCSEAIIVDGELDERMTAIINLSLDIRRV